MENRYAIGITNRFALFLEEGMEESTFSDIDEQKTREKKANRRKKTKAKQAVNPFNDYKFDERSGEVVKKESKSKKNKRKTVTNANEKKNEVENPVVEEEEEWVANVPSDEVKLEFEIPSKSKKKHGVKVQGKESAINQPKEGNTKEVRGTERKQNGNGKEASGAATSAVMDQPKEEHLEAPETVKRKHGVVKKASGAARRTMRLEKLRVKDVKVKETGIDLDNCIRYDEWILTNPTKVVLKLKVTEVAVEVPSTSKDTKEISKEGSVVDDSETKHGSVVGDSETKDGSVVGDSEAKDGSADGDSKTKDGSADGDSKTNDGSADVDSKTKDGSADGDSKTNDGSADGDSKTKDESVVDDSQGREKYTRKERKERSKRTRKPLPVTQLSIRYDGYSRTRGRGGPTPSDEDLMPRRRYRAPVPNVNDEKAFPQLI